MAYFVLMPHDSKGSCELEITRILRSWNADGYFDIDVYLHKRPGIVSRDSKRNFMIRIGGLWYNATFGGINGAPCATCFGKGIAADTGEIAYLLEQETIAQARVDQLRTQLKAAEEAEMIAAEKVKEALFRYDSI